VVFGSNPAVKESKIKDLLENQKARIGHQKPLWQHWWQQTAKLGQDDQRARHSGDGRRWHSAAGGRPARSTSNLNWEGDPRREA
jgi:hypothetical protein